MIKCLTLLALCLLPFVAQAQVCFEGADNTGCPRMTQDISTSTIRTAPGLTTVGGSITTSVPKVANSMVYKDASGTIMTTSNTAVANAGQASESLVVVNASINVLKLISPTTLPACNAAANGNIALSGAKLCVCNGTAYKNLLGGSDIVTGLLTGTCP